MQEEESELINQHDFWQNHSVSWKTSGLSQQEYCKQQGINFSSFVYQHNKVLQKRSKH